LPHKAKLIQIPISKKSNKINNNYIYNDGIVDDLTSYLEDELNNFDFVNGHIRSNNDGTHQPILITNQLRFPRKNSISSQSPSPVQYSNNATTIPVQHLPLSSSTSRYFTPINNRLSNNGSLSPNFNTKLRNLNSYDRPNTTSPSCY
jgi:hypothetical protein